MMQQPSVDSLRCFVLKQIIKRHGYAFMNREPEEIMVMIKRTASVLCGKLNLEPKPCQTMVERFVLYIPEAHSNFLRSVFRNKKANHHELSFHFKESRDSIIQGEMIAATFLLDQLREDSWGLNQLDILEEFSEDFFICFKMTKGKYKQFVEDLFADVEKYELRLKRKMRV